VDVQGTFAEVYYSFAEVYHSSGGCVRHFGGCRHRLASAIPGTELLTQLHRELANM